MSGCLRIFRAYSFRLSRRHSTFILLVSFVLTITIILNMYAFRHHHNSRNHQPVGDFDYMPGAFLKGEQPNENKTFCEFNYGLPYSLKWETIQEYQTPEAGHRSLYRVIYNAVRGTAFDNYSKYDAVTYATQATPEFIYHVIEIARYWDGPISLSVFVPDYDIDITMQIMIQLCHCYEGMSKVSLHLFYPKRYPPKLRPKGEKYTTTKVPTTTINITREQRFRIKLENFRNLDHKNRAEYIQTARKKKIANMMMRVPKKIGAPNLYFEDCSGLQSFDIQTFRRDQHMLYPINVGRNVARNASWTNYFIVSDIEMVPSNELASKFLRMVRTYMGNKKRDNRCIFPKTVFVVPLFEVEIGEVIPRDKETLVRMIAANRAMYFHQKACPHCQRFPGLQTWLMRPAPSIVEPLLIARREYPYHRWEPLYFGTQKEPWYSEVLSWEGRQDKMTQMLELCLQEYRMVVLDGAFLCHAASQKNPQNHDRAKKINLQKYMKIIESLKKKYPNKEQCKVDFGLKDESSKQLKAFSEDKTDIICV